MTQTIELFLSLPLLKIWITGGFIAVAYVMVNEEDHNGKTFVHAVVKDIWNAPFLALIGYGQIFITGWWLIAKFLFKKIRPTRWRK